MFFLWYAASSLAVDQSILGAQFIRLNGQFQGFRWAGALKSMKHPG
jgi:hypothetical protein